MSALTSSRMNASSEGEQRRFSARRLRNGSELSGTMIRETSAQRVSEFSKLVAHHRLLNRPEVVPTPHVAFNSHEAMERLNGITVENINAYLRAARPHLRVNYWLVKQEPTAYSWDDFVKDGKTRLDGCEKFSSAQQLAADESG